MLYKGSTKIGSFQLGSTKIGKLYKGSTLVYSSSAYKPDEIIFESSTAGTYSVDLLETGKYEVYCIAGGGGCSEYNDYSGKTGSGGSGSGFIGIVRINKGTYSIKVGSGGARGTNNGGDGTGGANSYIGELLIAYGGGGGYIRSSTHAGAGGAVPTISVIIISTQLNTSGNSGNVSTSYYVPGGAAVYLTYGAGGGSNSNGNAGYIKIIYKGK